MKVRTTLTLLLLAALISCGGTDETPTSSATCGPVSACGGDPAGHWQSASSCLAVTGTLDSCAAATFTGQAIKASVVVDYQTDKTFTLRRTFLGRVSGSLPAACLNQSGLQLSCSLVAQMLQGSGSTAACSDNAAGGCECSLDFSAVDTDKAGTYTVEGNLLTLSYAGTTEAYDFCAKGSELQISPHGGELKIALPNIGPATFSGDIVLKK